MTIDTRARKVLIAYMKHDILGKKWAVDALKDCSLEEFDEAVASLREDYGRYLRWLDIQDIRRGLSRNHD